MNLEFYLPTLHPTGLTGACGGNPAAQYHGYLNELFVSVDDFSSTGHFQFRKLYVKNNTRFTLTGIRFYFTDIEHTGHLSLTAETGVVFSTGSVQWYPPGFTSASFTAPTAYTGGSLYTGHVIPGGYAAVWLRQYLVTGSDPFATATLCVRSYR